MSKSVEHNDSRREFFRSAGRYGVLGLLSVVAVVTGRRSFGGQKCVNQGICRGCAVFNGCGLPQALSAKSAKRGGAS